MFTPINIHCIRVSSSFNLAILITQHLFKNLAICVKAVHYCFVTKLLILYYFNN